jgi:pyrimidine operon attenuation protein/uracil phosphoribosyltransferase
MHGHVIRWMAQTGRQDPRMTRRLIMTADEVRRAVIRISHEIVEKQAGTAGLVLVGIQRRGVPLARRLAAAIEEHEGARLPVGALDIEFYRDDARLGHSPLVKGTDVPFEVDDTTVVLVDDVLYTGRTIRADHVGKNVPTSREEVVKVRITEVDGEDAVDIEQVAAAVAGA